MKNFRFLLAAVAVIVLASCSNDDFIGGSDVAQRNASNGEITFASGMGAITRADIVGADAATLLGSKFIVLGMKGDGTATGMTPVFQNYLVQWQANSAGTSESNTHDWEYAGITAVDPSPIKGTTQTIKYWDYSAARYDFAAFSTGASSMITAGEPTAGQVLVSAIEYNGAEGKGYTMQGAAADLANCYIADMVTVEKDRYNPVLPASEYVVVKGTERNINLVPYGAAKLRVTVFPDAMRKNHKTLTDSLLVNPDFEQTSAATVNHGGIEKKTFKPYGWSVRGTLYGSSYGINHDAANHYGENVCWYRTLPFPLDFQLYQTVPASKLKPGAYRVRCLLWCQTGAFGTCGLFANNHVQYFGKESDYGENLPGGVVATFAGHKGTSGSTFIMQEMEVTVSIEEGESLTLGICTSGMKPDGTQASGSDATGWFKVDHFRIERVKDGEDGIGKLTPSSLNQEEADDACYNLMGQRLSNNYSGISVKKGKKVLKL